MSAERTSFSSGEMAQHCTPYTCLSNSVSGLRLRTSHTCEQRTILLGNYKVKKLSLPPATKTFCSQPLLLPTNKPLTLTVRSSELETIIFPEALMVQQVTMSLCPLKSASTIPVEESQSWEEERNKHHSSTAAHSWFTSTQSGLELYPCRSHSWPHSQAHCLISQTDLGTRLPSFMWPTFRLMS